MKPKSCSYFHPCTQGQLQRIGHYIRKSDSQRIQRYRCSRCKKSYSDAIKSPCYRQNKRHLNALIRKLLCAAMSQRRIALVLGISRLTVARKFEFLAKQETLKQEKYRLILAPVPLKEVFLDEMEDRIHTKCKPVSIALIVTPERKILHCELSSIRPKNRKLYEISKKKYPDWKDRSRQGFKRLLYSTAPLLDPQVVIRSDQKQMYDEEIRRLLPSTHHRRYKSRRAVIAGQGELKQGGKDPLFALNHTCAMMRANINRLIRRTWCSSKKIESLKKHILIYAAYHNTVLT